MNTGYVPPNSDQGHNRDTTQHMQNAAPARPKKNRMIEMALTSMNIDITAGNMI